MTAAEGPGLHVCVGILTFRRPELLATLLPQAVRELGTLNTALGGSGEVLVVDNDPEASARRVVAECAGPVRYVHEPTSGIAAARHRALTEAADADLLQFIDDDEEPEPGWLLTMVRTWHAEGRPAAVAGSVRPRYAVPPPAWVLAGGFFDRRQLPTGTEVAMAPSGNLLVDVAQVRRLGLQFDPRLGLMGGEDSLFTRQLTRAGGRIVFCQEAPIYDLVPAERATRPWVLRRAWHHGGVTSFVDLYETPPGPRRWWRRLVLGLGGLARAAAGGAQGVWGLLLRDARTEARGLRRAYKGLGMARGAVGAARPEYSRPAVGGS